MASEGRPALSREVVRPVGLQAGRRARPRTGPAPTWPVRHLGILAGGDVLGAMSRRRPIESPGPRLLGSRAAWGRVGYTGEAFAPPPATYRITDLAQLNYTTTADAGPHPTWGSGANLGPLLVAALCEAGFGAEAGPLATWSN